MTKSKQNTQPKTSNPIRWLITGGCGFIGLNLVKNLTEEAGHYIRIVDNLSVGTRKDLSQVCNFTELDPKTLTPSQPSVHSPKNPKDSSSSTIVKLIVADILDEKLAFKATKEIDIVVHLAANTGVEPSVEDPRSDCLNNVLGTLNYLEAARHNNVKRFIFASSGAPVGECEPPIHEELAPHPVSPYGASKLAGEAYCSAYFRTFGIKTVALRFGNVYGPLSGQKNSVVAKFIKRAMEAKPLEIYGDGTQTRDFIYVDDLISAIRKAVSIRPLYPKSSLHHAFPWGEIFQIATNTETTIRELVEELLPILSDSGFEKIEVHYTSPRVGDVKRNFSDTSKAKRLLGWEAQIPLIEGLNMTVKKFIQSFNP